LEDAVEPFAEARARCDRGERVKQRNAATRPDGCVVATDAELGIGAACSPVTSGLGHGPTVY
jgi:hypothetical protein